MTDQATDTDQPVAVIGGGFCGLAAAWHLANKGVQVQVFEADDALGGLAGSFEVGGTRLEKFYHHWFTSDTHVLELIHDLGLDQRVQLHNSRTGMYYANNFYRLSTPLDLLRFSPLSMLDRIRLGLLALRARRVRDWQQLEDLSAADWLRSLGGERVYQVVWEPLLRGKFGDAADDISAVWFWNKLKLRGGSRGKGGAEQLAYFEGGFAALAEATAEAIVAKGGEVHLNTAVTGFSSENGQITGVHTTSGHQPAQRVIATPALPLVADLCTSMDAGQAPADWLAQLRRIRYLANLCVVLELDRSLSDTYWLNVNDPSFPFVAVIEHTNFADASTYAGRHIVYLSRYLPTSDPMFSQDDVSLTRFTLDKLQQMFPGFSDTWVLASHIWRAQHSQPIVERHYSRLIPASATPVNGLYLASMAQIYPEDRGTNYAVRQGRDVAKLVLASLTNGDN